jgi:acetyl esterase/lipase
MRPQTPRPSNGWSAQTFRYGSHPEQFGQLYVSSVGSAPAPVAVLLHGGFWRSRWRLDLMDPLAADLAQRGIASWNVEYRRADRHGWDATTADVDAAVRYMNNLARRFPVDLTGLILIGHSAGGQLAVRVAADLCARAADVRPAVVVTLAGILDLTEAQHRDLGDGAVAAALGGSPAELPAVYAAASPVQRLPLGIAQIIVTAQDDSPDINDLSYRYIAAAHTAGDNVTAIQGAGDHFTLIDPASRVWTDTCGQMLAAVRSPDEGQPAGEPPAPG